MQDAYEFERPPVSIVWSVTAFDEEPQCSEEITRPSPWDPRNKLRFLLCRAAPDEAAVPSAAGCAENCVRSPQALTPHTRAFSMAPRYHQGSAMNKPLIRSVILVMAVALCLSPFRLSGQGKGNHKGAKAATAAAGVVFLPGDIRLIRAHFGPGGSGLPPGLAKKDSLPPGLQKQLRRKGTLPPGLQKKVVDLPPSLEGRLSPLPPGYRRVMVDRWAMIIATATNVIWDIIDLSRE
jgi:hypothetical protein